jgi:mono/diheme cytochrome c family protein
MRWLTVVVLLVGASKVAGAQDSITPQMIVLGDSIFHGKVAGGTCITCHQANAKGIPGLAPDLTDKTWLHSDGSLAAIIATIEKGVPKPKQAVAPMLPKGGANLTSDQIRAVAAYVYSLSHKG